MEPRSRSVRRPYLLQSNNEVDKFLRKQRLPSPYRRPLAYKFPTDLDLDRNNKYATTSVPSTNYSSTVVPSSASSNRTTNPGINNYSTSSTVSSAPAYNSYLERSRRLSGRPPLHGSSNLSNGDIGRLNGYGENKVLVNGLEPQDNDYGQQQQRHQYEHQIPVQQQYNNFNNNNTEDGNEARKQNKTHSSAFKSFRSFLKKLNLGFSHKRDYSAGPINKRFSSTQNLNGHLPSSSSATPIGGGHEHRRSNSISSASLPRRQSFNTLRSTSRAPDRPLPALPTTGYHVGTTTTTGTFGTTTSGVGITNLIVPDSSDEQPQKSNHDSSTEPPQFDDLMQRFSNLSTTSTTTRPRLPSSSQYNTPTPMSSQQQTGSLTRDYSVPATISTTNTTHQNQPKSTTNSSALPPSSMAPRRPVQNSMSSLQPRPATSEGLSSYANGTTARVQTTAAYDVDYDADKLLKKRTTTNVPCLKGLSNHGNTCYFSALIQCLACCEKFAKYFVCDGPAEETNKTVESDPPTAPLLLASALTATLRCLWFNHASADRACYKLLQLIGKANPQFVISQQQDAHECLIWLLDRLHEEIKERESQSMLLNNSLNGSGIFHRSHKSEGELANDALERVSGSNRSTVMDLFRAQFRSAMECTNPVCGFTNLTFDPYLTISLSVPQPRRPSEISVLFVPFFGARQIVRYHFQLADPVFTIWDIKERVMQHIRAPPEQTVACQIQTNGQCHFLSDDLQLEDRMKEITLLEVPKLNEQQLLQELVVAVIVFVLGIVPDGERYGYPFVVVLNRQWSYDRISSFLLEKGSFLLPRAFYPLPADYTLLIQHSSDQVACLDPGMAMPLFHDCINKVLCDKQPAAGGNVLKMIVEWGAAVRHEFQRASTELVSNDYTFARGRFQQNINTYGTTFGANQDEIPIPLVSLIEDYVKRECIQDWKCPKCERSPGRKELKFHSLPAVLIFHLKRFELLKEGVTNKIESRIQIPLEGLDMAPFIFNPDIRASTLPKHRRDRAASDYYQQEDSIYDLIGVISHFGQRTNSGHYTTTTRNPLDGQWRTFDDSRVSQPVGPADIRCSTKSYLLFYSRRNLQRKDEQLMIRSPASEWFPSAVPEEVVAKYGESGASETNSNGYGLGRTVGASKFYTAGGSSSMEPDDLKTTSNFSREIPIGRSLYSSAGSRSTTARSASLQPTSLSSNTASSSSDYHSPGFPLSGNTNGYVSTLAIRPSTASYTPSNRINRPFYSAYPRSSTRLVDYPRYSSTYKF